MYKFAVFLLFAIALSATDVVVTDVDNNAVTRTLTAHPRLWLDGPNGPMTTSIKDPDGPSTPGNPHTGKAPKYNHPAAVIFRQRAIARRGNLTEEAKGKQALALAIGYFMNNDEAFPGDGTTFRDEYMNAFRRARDRHHLFGACNYQAQICGNPLGDFAGEFGQWWNLSYTLMHDALTPSERTEIIQALFNGVTAPWCEFSLARREGTVSKAVITGNYLTISGASWDSSVQVGRVLGAKNPTRGGGVNWYTITSVSGDTIGVDSYVSPALINVPYYTRGPFTANTCGFYIWPLSHGYVPEYIVTSEAIKLSAAKGATSPAFPAVGGVIDTIQVSKSNWFPLGWDGQPIQTPFSIRVTSNNTGAGEAMRVLSVSGNTLTVLRGEYESTISHQANAPVTYWPWNDFNLESVATGWDNRGITRSQSLMGAALAFADESADARAILQKATSFWRNKTFLPIQQNWTLHNTSAPEYGAGRIGAHFPSFAMMLYNSFTVPIDYITTTSVWTQQMGLHNIYWTYPSDRRQSPRWGVEAGGNCNTEPNAWYHYATSCIEGPLFLNMFLQSDPIVAYMNYQHRDLAATNGGVSHYSVQLGTSKLSGDGASEEGVPLLRYLLIDGNDYSTWPSTDYRSILPTSKAWTKGETSTNGTGLGTFVSKTDWTYSATGFFGLFPNGFSDKMGYNDPRNTYWIWKNGALVGNARTGSEEAPGPAYSNTQDYGIAFKTGLRLNKTDLPKYMSAKDGQANYFYSSVDAVHDNDGNGSYHHVTRQFRQFAHFKTSPEYIIAFDDIAKTGTPERVRNMVHFVNNGGGGEGVTALNSAATAAESSNGNAKIQTQFLLNGAAVPKVYDLGVSFPASGSRVRIGADCSVAAPCRLLSSATVYSYTDAADLISFSAAPSSKIFGWVDTSGQRVFGRTSGVTAYSLSPNLVDGGVVSGIPGTAIARLFNLTVGNATSTTAIVDACPGSFAANTSTPAREWGTCNGGQNRTVWMDAGDTNNAEFTVIHHPTTNLAEAPVVAVDMGTINSGNFRGLYIPASTPTYFIAPRGQAKYSSLTVTLGHSSGAARTLFSGLNSGDWTITGPGGTFATPTIDTAGTYYSEAMTPGAYTFTFNSPLALVIETQSLPTLLLGQVMSPVTPSIAGGVPPYTCSIVSGAIPPGVTRNNCTFTGTPTTAGTYNFTFGVSDSASPTPATTSKAYSWPVTPATALSILTSSLPNGTLDGDYSAQLTAAGGAPGYTWSVASGSLPPSVSLQSNGLISGIPSATGTYNFTVQVSDTAAGTATKLLQIVVQAIAGPTVTIDQATLPNGIVGQIYAPPNGLTLTASGGVDPYTWGVTGSLPGGLTFVDGVLSGTPTGPPVVRTLIFTATDANENVGQQSLNITIQADFPYSHPVSSGRSLVVTFRDPSLLADQPCAWTLLDSSGATVTSGTIAAGPVVRTLGLTAGSNGSYTTRISCNLYQQDFPFTAVTPSGTATIQATLGPVPDGATAYLEYGTTASLGSSTSPIACGAGCKPAIVGINKGTIYYVRPVHVTNAGDLQRGAIILELR